MLEHKNILLIISGGIAAYKSLELIRLMRKNGAQVRCILTDGGAQFVTPLSVASLSENPVYTDLWSLKDETEMGHIRLSRESDLIVIAPASADLLAKMAHGHADDLATTALLASDKPIMICPAMNHMMWNNLATQDNIATLQKRGIMQTGPETGDMACGENGPGRMSEPEDILAAITHFFAQDKPLSGLKAVVTSGPTYEPLDPVRFIGNRSSGKQGHAIASALAGSGADVTLITGPVSLSDPKGINVIHVETGQQMLQQCTTHLPADIAVCAAAVGDWSPQKTQASKIKKSEQTPSFDLRENPDILQSLASHKNRPGLLIGFAAETENLIENAREKRTRKNCDWILANDVARESVFGDDENHVYLITPDNTEEWPRMRKTDIAQKLVRKITEHMQKNFIKQAAE